MMAQVVHERNGAAKHLTPDVIDRAVESGMLTADEARRLGELFGAQSWITDNTLDAGDRRLFYALEDRGVLRSEEESAVLPMAGTNWRIFYWGLSPKLLGGNGHS